MAGFGVPASGGSGYDPMTGLPNSYNSNSIQQLVRGLPKGWSTTGGGPGVPASATPGSDYEWNPLTASWSRTPASAGSRVSQFTSGALGGLYNAAGIGGTFGGTMNTTTPGAPGGTFGGGALGGTTGTGGGIGGGNNIGNIGDIDTSAADAAAFGKAKDIAGQTGRASLDALRGALGETGGLGSGAEAQGTRDIIENAAGQLGDVNRSLAETKAGQALDVAKSNQATQLAERGQNIQAQEAQARLAQEYAQMQFNNMMAQQQRQLDLLRLALGAGTSAMSAGGSSSFLY